MRLQLVIGLQILAFCRATLFIENETLPSLPGLFGKPMQIGQVYQARLQFLRENPYLCIPMNETSFVIPSDNSPVILIAARGNCQFHHKAAVAQFLHPSVEALIVYNAGTLDEDAIFPMYSEYGDSRLMLLSTSHRTGQDLKRYIAKQPQEVLLEGGPPLGFDGAEPEGLVSMEDLQEVLLSAIGLFFMMVSFSGCMVIIAGTYGRIFGGTRIIVNEQGRVTVSRALLTEEEVKRMTIKTDQHRIGSEDHSCAVCLDDFEEECIMLPCQHTFHEDCIVPWLTERQAKCPLCKFDLIAHFAEQQNQSEMQGTGATWFDRIFRYRRWTQVSPTDEHHDTSEEGTELELTEQSPVV